MTFKSPLVADNILKIRMAAAGFAVGPVVSTHYGLYLGFLNACFECRHICLIKILVAACCIELVSYGFRS